MRAPSLAAAVIFTVAAFIGIVVSVTIPSVALVGAVAGPVGAVWARWAAYGIQRTAHDRLAAAELRLAARKAAS